jgi:hypothetical protein
VASLRESKKGLAWRVALPRGGGAWSAAWALPSGEPLLRLSPAPGKPSEVRCEASGAFFSTPSLIPRFELPRGVSGSAVLDVAVNGEGMFAWPDAGSAAAKDRLFSFRFSDTPVSPRTYRHLRLTLSGGAALGAPAPPATPVPRGWLDPRALSRILEWSRTPAAAAAAAAEGVKDIAISAVLAEPAERGLALLQVFLETHSREEVRAGDLGVFGLAGAVRAVRVAAPTLEGGGADAMGASPGEGAPLSPSLVAPLVCPNAACRLLLAVDVPTSLAPNRGHHLSCTACGTGLCGHCGAPWCVPGGHGDASHAGVPCSKHQEILARLSAKLDLSVLGGVVGLVKKCPNAVCSLVHLRPRVRTHPLPNLPEIARFDSRPNTQP